MGVVVHLFEAHAPVTVRLSQIFGTLVISPQWICNMLCRLTKPCSLCFVLISLAMLPLNQAASCSPFCRHYVNDYAGNGNHGRHASGNFPLPCAQFSGI